MRGPPNLLIRTVFNVHIVGHVHESHVYAVEQLLMPVAKVEMLLTAMCHVVIQVHLFQISISNDLNSFKPIRKQTAKFAIA